MDRVRVIRIVQYVGLRDAVEKQIRASLHGTKEGARSPKTGEACLITAVTVGEFAEVLYCDRTQARACDIAIHGDLTRCNWCGLEWDTNDPHEPMCPERRKTEPALSRKGDG